MPDPLKELEQERELFGQLQREIYDLLIEAVQRNGGDPSIIDGSKYDGDPVNYTAEEVRQTLNFLEGKIGKGKAIKTEKGPRRAATTKQ